MQALQQISTPIGAYSAVIQVSSQYDMQQDTALRTAASGAIARGRQYLIDNKSTIYNKIDAVYQTSNASYIMRTINGYAHNPSEFVMLNGLLNNPINAAQTPRKPRPQPQLE